MCCDCVMPLLTRLVIFVEMKLLNDVSNERRYVATYDYVLYHLSSVHYNITSDKICS